MRTPGQPRARAAVSPRVSPMMKSGHDPRTARVRPPDAETGVRDDDDRADPQARVDDGRERGTGRDEERHTVALAHADAMQPGREAPHPIVELPPAHAHGGPDLRADMSTMAVACSPRRSSSPCQIGTNADSAGPVDAVGASASRGEVVFRPSNRSLWSRSHASTASAYGRSSAMRWPAPSNRCTSACGRRSRGRRGTGR